MNNKKLLFSFYFLALTLLFGCGGDMPPTLSETQTKAVEANRKAESAFKKGDFQKAVSFYNEALRINRSVENTDGIAVDLINLSIVYKEAGDAKNAHKHVDEVINNSYRTFTSAHLSEARFIKAKLYLDEKNHDAASERAVKASSFCDKAECPSAGGIQNLLGRIAIAKGNILAAKTHISRGLDLNRKALNRQEEANSLRLLADIKQIEGIYSEALNLYKEALEIDKSLGSSRKVSLDLTGMGNAACKQGKTDNAAAYFKRALSASEASGDKEGTAKIKASMEECLKGK
jgi:tetratricopeptide (TPR) repeat protein